MRHISKTILSVLLICGVSAQQTEQSQKIQNKGTTATIPIQKSPQPVQTTTGIQTTRVLICLNINEHEPEGQGDTFPPQVKRLYCFSQTKSSGEVQEIQHRWYWKDKLMSSIPLKIKSGNFRTYSAKSIPENATGDWRVAIVSSQNEEVIQTIQFYIK